MTAFTYYKVYYNLSHRLAPNWYLHLSLHRTMPELTLILDVPVGSVSLAEPTILVDSGQTVRALKNDIQDVNGIPCEEQILLYSNNILDESRSLESYDIQDGHKIQLSKRPACLLILSLSRSLRSVLVVRLPGKLPVIFHVNGKEITLHLQLTDSVFKIKKLLMSKGFPPVANLMLGSTRINDNATVEEAKLTPFSSVYCGFSLYRRWI